jgi:uncharacterized protein YcgI (DUF1989 family)
MNIPVHEDRNTLSFEEPTSKEGQYISLRAEIDLIIAFSNCPQVSDMSSYPASTKFSKIVLIIRLRLMVIQDILKTNGGKNMDVHFEIA